MWSDERLVALATTGDRDATRAIYERHALGLLRYNRCLLRHAPDARDALAEVFVAALRALRGGACPRPLRTWLYRLAHDECSARLRARRPVLVADGGVLTEPSHFGGDPFDALLDDLARLTHDHRAALLLHELDGFGDDEVAAVLRVSTPTASAAIVRARRALHHASGGDRPCDQVDEQLGRDHRGTATVAAHVLRCASCRGFRAGVRERSELLRRLGPDLPPGPLARSGARRARAAPRPPGLDIRSADPPD